MEYPATKNILAKDEIFQRGTGLELINDQNTPRFQVAEEDLILENVQVVHTFQIKRTLQKHLVVLAVQVHHVQRVLLRIHEVELLQVRVQGDGVGRFQTFFEDRFTASAIRTNLLNSLRTRIGEKKVACEN